MLDGMLLRKGDFLCKHEMGGHCVFGGADGPDMDMMQVFHAGNVLCGYADIFETYVLRHGVERKPQTLAGQAPRAEKDRDGDPDPQRGIEPVPSGVGYCNAADDQPE